jgi:type III secretion protein C
MVIGDSKIPLIDLSSVPVVHPAVFTKENPADNLPWKTTGYYHFAKNQDLKELVNNFCAAQSMNVVVSDVISDIANGKFSDITPCQFWKDIVNAYGLVWFFDGSMMYVYKSSEVTSNVYQMNRDEMRTLVKVIAQLGWLSSNVTFRPMETAGILVVSGPPKLTSLLEELLKKVVVERVSNVYDIRSFQLKHAWAYDMSVNYRGGNMNIPGVATMLQQIMTALPGPIGDSNIGVTINNSKSNEATATKAIPGTVHHTNESKANGNETKENSNNDNKNPVNLGEIFVTHDARLNAVIVKAKRQDMPFIENIIQQLDVSRDAIKIDVAVVDITKSGARKVGSKFAVKKRDTSGAAGNAAAAGGMERITFDFTDKASASVTMDFDKLFRNYSLAETLNILEDVGNAQTLTRSSVITLDNIGAVIDRSSTVYTAVTGAKAGGLYDVTVSTKLVVVPHIIPGEFDRNGAAKIKLLIEVTDGSFDKDARINANSPATATNSVNTEASLFEGQSLFIGGYFHENHQVSSAGVPFLKDLPILGYLFKVDNRDDSVAERIYIITPSIINMDEPKRTQLNRFFTDSQLSGEPTLKPDEFILTHDYERPSFDNATFKPKKTSFRSILSEKENTNFSKNTNPPEVPGEERLRKHRKACRRARK